jgi:hypothetical protein
MMPPPRDAGPYVLAFCFGIGALVLKVLYSFFPLANVIDAVLFAVLGGVAGRWRPERRWTLAVVVSMPALLLVGYIFVVGLDVEQLRQGIGIGWLLSVIVIPTAAIAGAWISTSKRIREDSADSGHARRTT